MEKLPKIELPPKSRELEIETSEDEDGSIGVKETKQKPTRAEKRRLRRVEELSLVKKQKMESLHHAIQNLDNGEPVDEFRDETRRVVFFDEDTGQYFIEDGDKKKIIGIGDIISDYAWGIKYVPDGQMTEPSYRTLAKRILSNEARRGIEDIYDKELGKTTTGGSISPKQPLSQIESQWGKWKNRPEGLLWLGFIAETAVRELLNREAINNKLNFAVLRANAKEDSIYKIDFKIHVYQRSRGVRVKQKEPKNAGSKVGIQFGLIEPRFARRKAEKIKQIKEKFGKELPVKDILLIAIQTKEFADAFNKWLELGKPSGGPEQFLSRDLKIELLKAVTKNLVEINDEEIERIFPN